MGQVAYQLRSEVEAHRHCHDQYLAQGDVAMVRKLGAALVSLARGLLPDWLRLRDGAMHRLGVGTTRDMRSVITGVFIPVCRCRAYTVAERVDIWRGIAFSKKLLWADFIQTDLTSQIHTLNLPTYFFSCLYDYTAHCDLARVLFDQIKAPARGFYTFGNSAHSPLFEEPQQVRSVLQQDVLAGEDNLADK